MTPVHTYEWMLSSPDGIPEMKNGDIRIALRSFVSIQFSKAHLTLTKS